MREQIWSHPAIARNRFYKEPQRKYNKAIGQHQSMTDNAITPDEMEYERHQECGDIGPEEELPF